MRSNRRRRLFGERGAVAVEFALIVPVLIAMLICLIELSFAFNAQITINNAAREAARTMAIHNDEGKSIEAAVDAAGTLDPDLLTVEITSGACTPNGTARAEIRYELTSITGLGPTITLGAVGAMLCGG